MPKIKASQLRLARFKRAQKSPAKIAVKAKQEKARLGSIKPLSSTYPSATSAVISLTSKQLLSTPKPKPFPQPKRLPAAVLSRSNGPVTRPILRKRPPPPVVAFGPYRGSNYRQRLSRSSKSAVKSLRLHQEWKAMIKSDREQYASLAQLRRLLGLSRAERTSHLEQEDPQDVVFVAIDCEWKQLRRLPNTEQLTELGISVLDLRDIRNLPPGSNAIQWIKKMRAYHVTIGGGSRRAHNFLFGHSQAVTPDRAQSSLTATLTSTELRGLTTPLIDSNLDSVHAPVPLQGILDRNERRRTALIGHSLQGDVDALRRFINFDVLTATKACLINRFDTFHLANEALRDTLAQGVETYLPSLKLGRLVTHLGLAPEYLTHDGSAKYTHNAGNDAAYTMMTLLLLATLPKLPELKPLTRTKAPVSRTSRLLSLKRWAANKSLQPRKRTNDRQQAEGGLASGEQQDTGTPTGIVAPLRTWLWKVLYGKRGRPRYGRYRENSSL